MSEEIKKTEEVEEKKEIKKDDKYKDVPVVIVLGASSGLGSELAKQYALVKGYRVVLAARREKNLQDLVKQIQDKGGKNVEYCVTDATDESSVKGLIDFTIKTFDRIDIGIYCAGIAMHVLFENITDLKAVMSKIMDVNFTGLVYFSYHIQKHLKKTKGSLCGISSVAGDISPSYLTFYAAAKHAMNGFLESLSNEEPGYTVTIACPGYIKTEIDEKKIVGDGTMQKVVLSLDESKNMTAEKAAELVIYAIDKKKLKYQLTNQGEIGIVLKSLFPSLINNAVKSEMKKLNDVSDKKE